MNELWDLSIKSTAIVVLTAVAGLGMRRASAASRHLLWLTCICALLVLPLGLLLPENPASVVLSQVVSGATGLGSVHSFKGSLIRFLPWIWLLGVAVMLVRLAAGGYRALNLIRGSRPFAETGEFEVRLTEARAGAAAWGFGRGVVLLPEDAISWTPERRRSVILHEAAHLQQRDCWALLIAQMACALYWFHPLVWFAAARLRSEQEHAADDSVLREGVRADAYASDLIAIARGGRQPALLAGAVRQSDLSMRVEAILDRKRRRTMRTKRMMLISLAALVTVAIPLAATQGRKIYKIGDQGVVAPRILQKNEPNYSEAAREAKIEGSVTLSAVIEDDGSVSNVMVERSLEPSLDANAIEAVQSWRFKPAEKEGKPVAVAAKIEVNFRLL